MEFKYRAVDEKPPSMTAQYSDCSYSTEQGVRAGYMGNPSHVGQGFAHQNDYYRDPIAMREAIWREQEKERIREEIIAEEIVRRSVLKAEVRREMMMERELSMQRGGNGFLYSSSSHAMRYEPRGIPARPLPHGVEGRFFQGEVPMSLEERLGMSAMQKHAGRFNSTPVQPQSSSEPRISEVESATEDSSRKEKMVLLDKSEENLAGTKRKAETPPAVDPSDLPSADASKKIGKEEWSCALCQVSATSHQGLNEHLQGKKHKAKEVASKNGRNYSIGLYPKKNAKSSKPVETADSSKPGMDDLADSERAKKNNFALSEDQKLGNPVKKNEKKARRKPKKPNSFKFWCEMCQVGAFNEKIIEAHKMGKKHITNLQKFNQNSGAEVSTQIMHLTGEAGQDGDNTPTENADGVVDGVELEAHQKEEPCADLDGLELEADKMGKAYADGGVEN